MTAADQIDLAKAPPFRVGPLSVVPALRQVTAATSETLEPRVMQVLVLLAMANGDIVSRDELVRQCWEGRIVGDDAINRVIVRLRRLLEDHGDAAVRIETITKVGYRLIGSVVLTAPPARPALASEVSAVTAADSMASAENTLVTKQRRWWPLAVAAAVLVALAVFGWRAVFPPMPPLQAKLRVGTFKALSPDVPPTLPASLESELQQRFGEATNTRISVVRDPPKDASSAYVVSGTIGRSRENLHFVVSLAREESGETPISLTFELPAAEGEVALKTVGAMSSRVVQCTLRGIAAARTEPLPDATVRQFAQFCRSNNAEPPNPAFELATLRETVKSSPDFAVGWAGLGAGLAATTSEQDIAERRGSYVEAMAAIAEAERLGLSSYLIENARARLTRASDWGTRGALLRQAAEKYGTESNGVAPGNYGNFLLNVGYVTQANHQHRLSLQINPLASRGAARHAMGMSWAGQAAKAETMTREVLATWPGEPIAVQHRIGNALWHGNYAGALDALAAAPNVKPEIRVAIAQTVAALKSGDARAKAVAADRLVALGTAKDTREPFTIAALAALGRDADALAIAEATFAGERLPSTAILFQPALARARALPAFAELAQRLGLVDYWRTTRQLPDFCKAAGPPPLCAQLK